MRVFSFCQESQRYCNYSKDKFGNEITFIQPGWIDEYRASAIDIHFFASLRDAESSYFRLLDDGLKPQQAREVLPNATKTELVMTGFKSQWKEFFKLRCSKAAHPMMQELANQIKKLI